MAQHIAGPYQALPVPSCMPYVRGIFATRDAGPDIPLGYVGIESGLGAQVTPAEAVATAELLACAPAMFGALQWLLDDMHDAGETHGGDGEIFDSVEDAAAALVEAGGNLSWYSLDDAKAYRQREASEELEPKTTYLCVGTYDDGSRFADTIEATDAEDAEVAAGNNWPSVNWAGFVCLRDGIMTVEG